MDERGAGPRVGRVLSAGRRALAALRPGSAARPRPGRPVAASRDPLTGLADRSALHDRAATTLRPGAPTRALLLLDLDGFKQVNDAVGHVAGDEVLRDVARRVAAAVGPDDLAVRLGGDEFVVLTGPLDAATTATTATAASGSRSARRRVEATVEALADRLLDALAAPVPVEDMRLRVGASVGVAVLGRDGTSLEQLLRAADQAMYAAKAAGATAGLRRRASREEWADGRSDESLADDLRRALDGDDDAAGGRLLLHLQPQVAWDGQVGGYESLLRWRHPDLGLLGPRRFLPVAQRAGLLGRLTLLALDQALAAHPRLTATGPAVTVSVNVSARDLLGDGFVDDVAARLATTGVAPDRLVLELAEPPPFPVPSAVALFHRLAELGVRISIHEFGARQSSLATLAQYPGLREVKIDPTLVRQVPGDEGITRLVRAITGAARELGVEVVAEGVEDAGVVPTLRELGCDRLQGFWLAPPAPLADTLAWAARWPAERELRLTV